MKVKTLLANSVTRLNSDEAKLEVQLLLQHVLCVNRAWLIAHENDALEANGPGPPLSNSSNEFDSPCIHAAYRALINRRANGEPIAYILGVREFYGLSLKVTPATLIPRADTETLVDAALAKIPQNDNTSTPSLPRKREFMLNLNQKMDSRFRGNDDLSVLDLGTGSGAIALAIAKHRPNVSVTATDASQAALDVAIENARALKIANVDFALSDWFSALSQQNNTQKFDLIVSNPPYIAEGDKHLSSGDLPWEPHSALVPGQSFSLIGKSDSKEDGLSAIMQIISDAPNYLKPQGWLMLEHGFDQAEKVANLLAAAGFCKVETLKDLGGNDRVTLGCYGTAGGA